MTLKNELKKIGKQAKTAASILSITNSEIKAKALIKSSENIIKNTENIIKENKIDIENAYSNKLSSALIDRLTLDKERILSIAGSLEEIAALPDPVGKILSEWERPNGLKIKKITVPIGVIGIIYESRPNVTADASALSIKSGNAVILRGGKDSFYSSSHIFKVLEESWKLIFLEH